MTPEIPGYKIQREIGKGGMGMVYLARRESDDATVAIKVLPPNLLTANSARRKMRRRSPMWTQARVRRTLPKYSRRRCGTPVGSANQTRSTRWM